jgi:hypothetical protein
MTSDALLATIHDLRRRSIVGDDAAAADLHAYRMQLLRQRERVVRGWRRCARCHRPADDFQGARGRICAACRANRRAAYDRAYASAYHAAHTEQQRAKMRANYERNKTAYYARRDKWIAENHDRNLEQKRASNARHREARNAATRARYWAQKGGGNA